MIRLMRLGTLGISVSLGLSAVACGVADSATSAEGSIAPAGSSLGERLSLLDRDLDVGVTGEDVRAVQDYLTKHGYFPNTELAERYPAWRPLIPESPTPGVFDRAIHDAIRELQTSSGLKKSGAVDAPTRALLQLGRCGTPEGIPEFDASNKFARQGSVWSSSTLTYRVMNTNDVTMAQARAAATAAFNTWTAQTSKTFTELTSGTADIQITFASIDGAGGILAQAASPSGGGDVTVDTAETWSVATPTPSGQHDLQTAILHELGHSLGLLHSSFSAATMYPYLPPSGSQDRVLDIDDNVGISTLYDNFQMLPGTAVDVGAGGSNTWIIGTSPVTGGYTIFKWDGSSWTMSDGGAVRIAVTSSGVPWIVNSAGEIFQRTSSSPSSGSWSIKPGCATDIGVGLDGSVWITGCSPINGGYGIHKWDGSGWPQDSALGGAVRIAVGPTGIPWIVNNAGSIFRRTSSNPSTGSWEMLPGGAQDIGIGSGNYAWIIGTSPVTGGYNIWAWNEQSPYSDGTVTAPARQEWVNLAGGAVQISVGANGQPWIVNNAGNIFRAQP